VLVAKRLENGYRCYDENDIIALKYLVVMKYAHFTLSEIKNLKELQSRDTESQCNEIAKRIFNAKSVELNQAISNYQKIILLFERLLPMIEDSAAYYNNTDKINAFIEQIFIDISQRNEVKK
jgi:MerR family Zn(II)-responsive transcriptional regulator of zntA